MTTIVLYLKFENQIVESRVVTNSNRMILLHYIFTINFNSGDSIKWYPFFVHVYLRICVRCSSKLKILIRNTDISSIAILFFHPIRISRV